MCDVDEILSDLEPGNPMVEAVTGAFGSIFGFRPKQPIAPLVDWIVHTSALPRTQVDNFVRAHRNDPGVVRAINGDEASRCVIMKQIALALGIDIFNDAFTVPEILNAARINASRPMDEAAGVPGKPLVEHVEYRKGHKDSRGEDAPWVIVSCQTGKILSSHKTKEKAEEHLGQMKYYKHKK
ncbi:MAG: hypothetical protein IKA48_00645 [Fibrobacter sp.]|nr:hypothetical protein [Fibrobacter sp.]